MKRFIVRVALPCIILYVILTMIGCKKDSQLSKDIQPNINDSAILATSAPTVSYMVTTVAGGRNNFIPYPLAICSSADGSIFAATFLNVAGIIKVGDNGTYTQYLDSDGIKGIKAGANGSLYFVKNYVINNMVLDSFNVFKVDRNKKVTMVPVSEKLSGVTDIAIGPDSSIYLSEFNNSRIIKITKQGVQSVFAGKKGVLGYADGPRDKAHFTYPTSLKFGEDGNLWVLDGAVYNIGQRIRKISMDGTVTTMYTLKYDYQNYNYITAFAVTKRDKNFNLTANENVLFFVTKYTNGNRISSNQLFHLSNTNVLTPMTANLPANGAFEKDGSTAESTFFGPSGLTVNPKGIFVADQTGGSIRKIARQ